MVACEMVPRERYGSGPITVVDYNPAWPALFAQEQHAVAGALGSMVIAIEHVGSTAVPGLAAKPIIDLLATVADLEQARSTMVIPLAELGYVHLADYEAWLPDQMLFRKSTQGTWTHHLHVMEPGSPRWVELVLIRDYLRGHSDAVAAYTELKRSLASSHGDDIAGYREGKAPFLRAILVRAR